MPLKRKPSSASKKNIKIKFAEEEHYELYDRSDVNIPKTHYNNLYNDDVDDELVDQTGGDVIISDVDEEEDEDEDDELDEEVDQLDQIDGEDRNYSNNASANITSNKASTNLTQSNLTSGPSSTISMYPIFRPLLTNTKDTSLKHANKTYIRPKVTPMDSQPLTSIKTSKVSTKKALSKSSAPNPPPEIKLVATNHVLKNQIQQLTKAIATNKMKASVLLPKSHIPRHSTSNPKSCLNETSLQLFMEGQNATIQLMNNSLNIVNGLVDRRNLAAQDPHNPTVSASASRSNLSQVNIDSNLYLKPPTLLTTETTYMAPTTLSIPNTVIKNPDPCKHYLNGQCWYGDICRFSHTT